MRYDAEHKQKTRSKVLEVAAKAIRSDGPDRIGVAGVMAEAGLTHGGFYAHFKSKDELVAAAIEQMFEESRARVAHEMEGHPPAEGLANYIDFYLSKKHRDARGAGCPMAALSSDLPRLPEQTRALLDFEVPGIGEAIRAYGAAKGIPAAALSRGTAGVIGSCLVVNLPGSKGGVKDGLEVLAPILEHAVEQIVGSDH